MGVPSSKMRGECSLMSQRASEFWVQMSGAAHFPGCLAPVGWRGCDAVPRRRGMLWVPLLGRRGLPDERRRGRMHAAAPNERERRRLEWRGQGPIARRGSRAYPTSCDFAHLCLWSLRPLELGDIAVALRGTGEQPELLLHARRRLDDDEWPG